MANDESLIAGTAADIATFTSADEIRNFPTQVGQWIDWYPPNFKKGTAPRRTSTRQTLDYSTRTHGVIQGAWVFDALDFSQMNYIIDTFFSGDENKGSAVASIKVYSKVRDVKYYVVHLRNPLLADGINPQSQSWDDVRFAYSVISEIVL